MDTRVEVPIPDQDPVSNLYGTAILNMLGLNFWSGWDWISTGLGTNSAMTHVLVLSAKAKRNERFDRL